MKNDERRKYEALRVGLTVGLLFIAASSYLTFKDGGGPQWLFFSLLSALAGILAAPGKRR